MGMVFKRFKLHSSLEKNVRLIAIARLVLLAFGQFFVLLNHFFFDVDIVLFWAEFCLFLLALSAALTFLQLKQISLNQKHLENKVRLQLVSDVVILSLLFHVTGGAANPFVSILLFPLVISASILPGRFNWFMVLLTLTCYGSLFLFESSMTQHDQMAGSMNGHQHNMASSDVSSMFSLHIIGMWFNFAISAVLISFFVVRMRQEIDQQQTQLNEQREQSLRDEQLLAIATQAASAAHHLGTPLSTMNVIINDLQQESSFPNDYKEDLSVLASQVANCKEVLNSLRHQAETENENNNESLSQFLATLLDEFHLLRAQIKLNVEGIDQVPKDALIMSDPTLRMAILNVLNNAADVSPEKVIFHIQYQDGHLLIDITDFGEGFDLEKDGLPINSSKQDGLGLGLFLSHATLNRYGGKISIKQQDSSGTRMHIDIPLPS